MDGVRYGSRRVFPGWLGPPSLPPAAPIGHWEWTPVGCRGQGRFLTLEAALLDRAAASQLMLHGSGSPAWHCMDRRRPHEATPQRPELHVPGSSAACTESRAWKASQKVDQSNFNYSASTGQTIYGKASKMQGAGELSEWYPDAHPQRFWFSRFALKFFFKLIKLLHFFGCTGSSLLHTGFL